MPSPEPDNINERVLTWVSENINHADSSEIGLASSLYRACLRTMISLCQQSAASEKLSHGRKTQLLESHARLCLFGDGLLHEGELELCLKVDNDLRQEIIELLYRLGKTILTGANNLYHIYDPARKRKELVSGLADLVESASFVLSHRDERGDDTHPDSENSESEDSDSEYEICVSSEGDNFVDALNVYTTSLMDLRPTLEQSLSDISKSTLEKTKGLPTFKVTEAARPYVMQVYDKFGNAETGLIERLGEANWQRYEELKKLSECTVAEPPIQISKSTFRPVSQFHDSGLGTSVPSHSQYAASNASHTSFRSTETDAKKGRMRVPRTPTEVSEGKAFTCSICLQDISKIKTRVNWKMHVFADLNAYICTFLDCKDYLKMYPTRKLWAEHEFVVHRSHTHYECHDCSQTFLDEKQFVVHITGKHGSADLNRTQLLATISAAKRVLFKPVDEEACPLCQKRDWRLKRDFVTHLGRHLEEIALAALPRGDGSESESGDETDSAILEKLPLLPLSSREDPTSPDENIERHSLPLLLPFDEAPHESLPLILAFEPDSTDVEGRSSAKAEIDKFIGDNEAARRGQGGAPPRGRNAQPAAPPSDGDSEQILVPDRTVGLIIGRGGETIRDLQERSGCHVNIVGENKSVNGFRPVNLIGTPQQQQRAIDLIYEIVESDTKTSGGAGSRTERPIQ